MLYAVGVYHPRPGAYQLPKNYSLTRDELATINVTNVPLTIEHRGIFDAVGSLAAQNQSITAESVGAELDRLAATDALKAPVGVVIEGRESLADGRWYCLIAIDNNQFDVIPFLIHNNALAGLSLTHLTGSTLTGTEISLCFKPARPECYIVKTFAALSTAMQYMRERCTAVLPPSIMAASANTAATTTATTTGEEIPTPNRLETFDDVINTMDDRAREIVAARFTSMIKTVEAAKKRAEDAENTRNVMKINTDLLKSQIEQMSKNMTPEVQRVYSCTADQLSKEFCSDSADVLKHAAQRMLMACNHQLMIANARTIDESMTVATETPRKRRALDEEHVVPHPPSQNLTAASATVAAAAAPATQSASPAATSDPKQMLADAISRFQEFEML
jgi:hypothetical protein